MNDEEKKSKAKLEKAKLEKKVADKEAAQVFELVRLRNNFYRDSYRRLITLLLLMAAAIVALSSIMYYMYTHRPAPKYFATDTQGQLIQIMPLNKPGISDGEVLNWATRGITAAFTLNFVQWRQQLQTVQDTYFTISGSENYLDALKGAQTLDLIQKNKFVATAEATAAPIITRRAPDNSPNPYYWIIKMPILMTLQNTENLIRMNMEVEMIVVRSSRFIDNKAVSIDAARGIGISRFLARSLRQPNQPVPAASNSEV